MPTNFASQSLLHVAIVPDGSAPPPDTPNAYVPSACPGGSVSGCHAPIAPVPS